VIYFDWMEGEYESEERVILCRDTFKR
jgi:hypothetical protein